MCVILLWWCWQWKNDENGDCDDKTESKSSRDDVIGKVEGDATKRVESGGDVESGVIIEVKGGVTGGVKGGLTGGVKGGVTSGVGDGEATIVVAIDDDDDLSGDGITVDNVSKLLVLKPQTSCKASIASLIETSSTSILKSK